MRKNERGAIVVEATISLSVFMFAIVTLLSIVNICYAQSKIGVAINSTAKEISQYSYLYGLTGLNQKQAALSSKGDNVRDQTGKILGGVTELYDSASSLGTSASSGMPDQEELSKAYDGAKDSFDTIQSNVEAIAADPKEFIMGSAYLFANGAIEEVKSKAIAAPMAKAMVKKHLVDSSGDCDAFLKHLGIKDGLNGLDFGDSVLFLNGSDEIKIVVHYDIQVIELLGIDVEFSFTQCAATKAWFKGVSTAQPPAQSAEGGGQGEEGKAEGGAGENPPKESENSGLQDGEKTEGGEVVQPPKEEQKSYADYAKEATHNASSDQVILGTYRPNFAPDNYIDMANQFGATYFNMEDWDEVSEKIGKENMWNINKEFLEQQEAAGKTFFLTEDPYHATGYFGNEVAWLEAHGYTFKFDPGVSMWKAVKE